MVNSERTLTHCGGALSPPGEALRLRGNPVQWAAAAGPGDRNPVRYRNDGVSQDLHTQADGAYVYACRDAARVARDVDEALRGIVAQQSGRSPKSAAACRYALSAERRYVRNVY